MKFDSAESLHQDLVTELLFPSNDIHIDQAIVHRFPNKVILHFDVLALSMEYRILDRSNSRLVVYLQHWCTRSPSLHFR